jgi:hypothetical protein
MTRRRVVGTTILLTLVVVALLTMAYVPLFGGDVVSQAAVSPVGRLAMLFIVGGLVLIGLLCLFVRRCSQRPHTPMRDFFRSDGGSAAVEMLLGLPIILMILLMVIQATVLWNANMVFHYAAFATARTMSSVIPCDIDYNLNGYEDPAGASDNPDSTQYLARERECLVFADDEQENAELSPDSAKTQLIRLAAIAALVPISDRIRANAGIDENPFMTGDAFAAATIASRGNALAGGGSEDPAWYGRIAEQFRYADYYLQLTIDIPHHWYYQGTARGERCPYRHGYSEWGNAGFIYIPYCPYAPKGVLDYAPWEKVKITVEFPYSLGIPYGGRVIHRVIMATNPEMGREETLPGSSRTSYQLWMKQELEFILSG